MSLTCSPCPNWRWFWSKKPQASEESDDEQSLVQDPVEEIDTPFMQELSLSAVLTQLESTARLGETMRFYDASHYTETFDIVIEALSALGFECTTQDDDDGNPSSLYSISGWTQFDLDNAQGSDALRRVSSAFQLKKAAIDHANARVRSECFAQIREHADNVARELVPVGQSHCFHLVNPTDQPVNFRLNQTVITAFLPEEANVSLLDDTSIFVTLESVEAAQRVLEALESVSITLAAQAALPE